PGKLCGAEVPLPSRIAHLSEFVEVAHRVDGPEGARRLARQRGGGQFDPDLAAVVTRDADAILAGLQDVGTWEAVIAAEPALAIVLSGEQFDAALTAIAEFSDLKSPFFPRPFPG